MASILTIGKSKLRRYKLGIDSRINEYGRIYYVIEDANWSIKWDGISITSNIKKLFNIEAKTVTNYNDIKNQILHLGSRGLYVPHGWRDIDTSNKVIYTWFHGDKTDQDPQNIAMIEAFPDAAKICEFVHTTNNRTKERLIEWGIPRDKIIEIPLGVDLNLFTPQNRTVKEEIKTELGIPEGSLCIGSFQKDGVGWEEGNEPKLVKGPDIFCEVAIELSKQYPIFVLLIGPARGYVKKRLRAACVPFYHIYLENFMDVPKYYHALDLYLVTSRDEGGPKAILESMASGVPLVTTDVGMAKDVINHGKNGFIAGIENVDEIVRLSSDILENTEKTASIVLNALETVKRYSWENIATLYYEKMYSELLS